MNGALDLIFGFITSILVIVARVTTLTAPENIVWLIAPVLTAVVGLSMFSYMLAKEQRVLFLLEHVSSK
jgi:hypothetical protein